MEPRGVDGNVYVKGGKGFYGTSFLSARGSDPESGSSGSGLDEDAMWDALAAGTSEQINVTHIPALNISKITGLKSALDGKLNNGSTTYDTAYARNLTINGITYGIWATANPAALGPFYIPTSAGTSGYILQSTGGVPAWISRAALTQQLFTVNRGCVHIPENSDLNDYTTPGLYSCWANATVATIANVPNTAAFSLVVLQTAGVIQIFREYGYGFNANEYTRRYYNGTWTSWVRAPRLNELYTKKEADGRYLKLSGGTLTGDLTTRNVLLPANYNIVYSVTETGAAMVGFRNGRTVLGTIGASTTAATHLRSITGHATIGSSDAATYNILDTGNYTTYTVTKTGGGASGTWGISISGNAASATTATNATNLAEVAGTKYLYHLRTNGYNIDTGSTVNPRVYEINNPDGTPPTTNPWIQVLMWGSGDSGYGTQLANQYNVEGNLYFRNKISGTWKPWRTLLDSSNYTSYTLNRDAIVSTIGVSGKDLVGWTYNGNVRSRVTQAQLRTMLGLGSNAYTSTAYLPLAGGTLTGQLNGRGANFNTGNGSTPFVISRGGLTRESVAISINDLITRFDVTNDETSASLLFYLSATDTESGGGAAAKTGYVNDILDMNTIYTRYGYGGIQRMRVGWTSADGAYLQNDVSGGAYLSITNTGDLMFNGGKVWHAGNDGSGSGLDADLLDGTQKSGLLTSVASTAAANLSVTVGGTTKSVADLYATYLDGYPATSFDLSTNLGACQDFGCYVIGLMQITDYTTVGNHANGELILIRQNGYNPTAKVIYSLSTKYNTTDVRFGHLVLGCYSNYVIPCTFTYNGKKWAGFNVTTAASYTNGVVCKRDGLRLGEKSAPFLLKYKVSNTGEVLNSEVNGSLVVNGSDIVEDGVSTNRFVGPLEGNAATATKLATARTLWGKSFDGSGYVSGDMTGVGLINGALHIEEGDDIVRLGTSNHVTEFYGYGYLYKKYYFRPGYSSAGATTAAVYIQNASASENPTFSTTHFFNKSGVAYHSGKLGIGTTDPAHALEVVGSAKMSSGMLSSYIELSSTTPFIDFHYDRSSADYTTRIIEGVSGQLTLIGNLQIGGSYNTASGYKFSVNGTSNFTGRVYAQNGVTIGATDDIGWYLNNSRLAAGFNTARGVNVGSLLVSNAWADYTKVPANGIYAKGAVLTDSYLQVGSGRLRWDAANNALYVEKSDGTACGLYSKGYMSARGSDPEAATGGSSELVPVVTISKLTVGTSVSISVLDNAGLTADVREKMCDGTIGRVKAVFSDGSTEIWPVLHASERFISFGYDTVAGGYQDTMDIYEITIPSKTSVIRVEHFER